VLDYNHKRRLISPSDDFDHCMVCKKEKKAIAMVEPIGWKHQTSKSPSMSMPNLNENISTQYFHFSLALAAMSKHFGGLIWLALISHCL
jgi:hypothetical protein